MVQSIARTVKVLSLLGSVLFVGGQIAYMIPDELVGEWTYLMCAIAYFIGSILDWMDYEINQKRKAKRLAPVVNNSVKV